MDGTQIPIGQTAATTFLEAAIACDRVAPAYLFAGPEGVGRAIAARYFARRLLGDRHQLANHPDLLWIEPTYLHNGQLYTVAEAEDKGLKRKTSPQIRLEQVRAIARFLSRPPLQADRSLVIIDRAETMAEAAANGLLKTLEEPGRATLILIAPSAESLLPTLVSRCQRLPFYRLSPEDLARVLTNCGYDEILQQPAIIAASQGSPGAAIASWERLQDIPADTLDRATQPPRSLRAALELAREIAKTFETPDQIWLIEYLQNAYWQKRGVAAYPAIERLDLARKHLQAFVQPRLVWEVALIDITKSLR
ncbi:MAG: DNA polymerase III subunit delta' [Geitlerinemataceae cyanobacterium]